MSPRDFYKKINDVYRTLIRSKRCAQLTKKKKIYIYLNNGDELGQQLTRKRPSTNARTNVVRAIIIRTIKVRKINNNMFQ